MAVDTSMSMDAGMQAQMQTQIQNQMSATEADAARAGENQEQQRSEMSIAASSPDSSGLAPWQGQQVDITA
jgi:hypothetical protein